MWSSKDRDAAEALETLVRGLRSDLRDIDERCRTLESRMESVTADSLLQWEKVTRALGRLAKRAEVQSAERDGRTEQGACHSIDEKNEIIRRGGDPWQTPS